MRKQRLQQVLVAVMIIVLVLSSNIQPLAEWLGEVLGQDTEAEIASEVLDEVIEEDTFYSSITGVVWQDENNNGEQDEGEEGVNDIELLLEQETEGEWIEVAKETTAENAEQALGDSGAGFFAFAGLRKGTYKLSIRLNSDQEEHYGNSELEREVVLDEDGEEEVGFGLKVLAEEDETDNQESMEGAEEEPEEEGETDIEFQQEKKEAAGMQAVYEAMNESETSRTRVDIDLATVDSDGPGYTYAGGVITFNAEANNCRYVITQTVEETVNRIEIGANVDTEIMINGININTSGGSPISLGSKAKLRLSVQGNNKLTGRGLDDAGIEVPANREIAIEGDGRLEIQGGNKGAGIGGANSAALRNAGIIEIGGNITLSIHKNNYGAGIGGGAIGNGGYITIGGAADIIIDEVYHGSPGAGIGGGGGITTNSKRSDAYGGQSGSIIIGEHAAIKIKITGGGSGIGGGGGGADRVGSSVNYIGGNGGTGEDITIKGEADITIAHSGYGSGIGGGAANTDNGNSGVGGYSGKIVISESADIKINGSNTGIGGGYSAYSHAGNVDSIKIEGQSKVSIDAGTGIGGGDSQGKNIDGVAGNISISDNALVKVISRTNMSSGAGIGGRNGNIVIEGGDVYVKSTRDAIHAGGITILSDAAVAAYSQSGQGIYSNAWINEAIDGERGYIINNTLDRFIDNEEHTVIDICDEQTGDSVGRFELPPLFVSYAGTVKGISHIENHSAYSPKGEALGLIVKKQDYDPQLISKNDNLVHTDVTLVKNLIRGTVWRDANRNGYLDDFELEGAGIEGQNIDIYEETESGSIRVRRTRTKADGSYVAALPQGIYKVKFPDISGLGYTVKRDGDRGSHINEDGFSDSYEFPGVTGTKYFNGGYWGPDIDNNLFFEKAVRDPETGIFSSEVKFLDPEEELVYQLSFVLPEDMREFSSIELQDILPENLELSTGSIDTDVSGWLDEAESIPADFSYDEEARIISCVLQQETSKGVSEAYGYLAGKKVTMEVKAKLIEGAVAVNTGKILINDEENNGIVITKDKNHNPVQAKAELTASLSGIVFTDTNDSGYFEAGIDEIRAGVPVVLYERNNKVAIDRTTTDSEGRYEFFVSLDKDYYVSFPVDHELSRLIPIKDEADPTSSHAIPTSGYTSYRRAVYDERELILNAGYAASDIKKPQFSYHIQTSGGLEKYKALFDLDTDIVAYVIEVELPSDMDKYEELKVEIQLHNELELVDETDIGEVAVSGLGDSRTVGALSKWRDYITFASVSGYDLKNLQGKKITIEIPVRVKDNLDNYSAEAMISPGKVYVNDAYMVPSEGNPEAQILGTITGTVFDDDLGTDGGVLESGEELEDIPVELLEQNANGIYTKTAETVTGSDGTYRFDVPLGKHYQIRYPELVGTRGLIAPGDDLDDTEISHAMRHNYRSPELFIDTCFDYHGTADSTRFYAVNAGYKEPDTSSIDFTKLATDPDDPDGTTDKVTVSDNEQVVEFQLSFRLPDDMSGYQRIELQDILPAGLSPSEIIWQDAVAAAYQKDGEAEVSLKYSDYQVSRDGQILRLVISHTEAFDITEMEEAVLTMRVKVRLDRNLPSYNSVTLVNNGKLIINSGDNGAADKPEVEVVKSIRGTIFEDVPDPVTGEKNGRYDEGEAYLQPFTVTLLKRQQDGSFAEEDNVTTTTGRYRFDVIVGETYQIEVQKIIEEDIYYKGLLPKGGTADTLASHINMKTGLSDAITIQDMADPYVLNAGYTKPIAEPDDWQFHKQFLYDEEEGPVITDLEDVLTFAVRMNLPSDLSGYNTIKMIDYLPTELEPVFQDDLSEAVKVIAVTRDSSAREMEVQGELHYTQEDGISILITDLEALMNFARGSEIELIMEVKAKLTAASDYPDTIKNSAGLIINGDEEHEQNDEEDPELEIEIGLRGKISGIVFEDMDDSGDYSSGDFLLKNVKVELYKAGNTTGTPDSVMYTNGAGSYAFTVETGADYYIKVPRARGFAVLLDKAQGDSANASHMNSDGTSDIVQVTKQNRMHKKNAGYAEGERGGRVFKKEILDDTGTYGTIYKTADAGQVFRYRIELKMPLYIGEFGFVQIEDTLPEGMKLHGNADDAVVEVEGGRIAVELGYNPMERLFTCMIPADYDNEQLAGQTIVIYLMTELEDDYLDGTKAYPADGFTNEARLLLKEEHDPGAEEHYIEVDEGNPDLFIKGEIKGTAFLAGTIPPELADALVTVSLYKKNSAGYFGMTPAEQQTIKLGDSYRFLTDLDGVYKVHFSNPCGTAGLMETASEYQGMRNDANPADGYSQLIEIEDHDGNDKRIWTINAGYKKPEIDEEDLDFRKLVWNEEEQEWQKVLESAEPEQEFYYRLSFHLPEQMEGYQSIEIRDILPEELMLIDDLSEAVRLYEGTNEITAAEIEIDGQTVTCCLKRSEAYDLTELKGKTIYMYVRAVLTEEAKQSSEPLELLNRGVLVFNSGVEIIPGTDPEPGEISGIIFQDKDENGRYDSGEAYAKAITVTLYTKDEAGQFTAAVGTPLVTTTGFYLFDELEAGEYQVGFDTTLEGKGLITPASGPDASHVDEATGRTDTLTITDAGEQYIRNAGYLYEEEDDGGGTDPGTDPGPGPGEEQLSLTKTGIDSDGKETNTVELIDVEAEIRFCITFSFAGDITRYKQLELRDMLPAGVIPKDTTQLLNSIPSVTVMNKAGQSQKISGTPVYENGYLGYQITDIETLRQFSSGDAFTVMMEVVLKLEEQETYAVSFINSAKAVLIPADEEEEEEEKEIDTDDDKEPEIKVLGLLEGMVFDDRDYDGYISTGDAGLPQREVTIIQDGAELTKVMTASDGTYRYKAELGHDYQIKVAPEDNLAELTKQHPLTEKKGSHPDEKGGTRPGITPAVSLQAKKGETKGILNAGYHEDQDSRGNRAFTKKVWDEDTNSYTGKTTLTDTGQPIRYQLEVRMPDSLAAYHPVAVEDLLPAGLVLDGELDTAVKVEMEGASIKESHGSLTLAEETGDNGETRERIIFTVGQAQYRDVQGKTVIITIDTRIREGLEIAPEEQPIRNSGYLRLGDVWLSPDNGNPDVFVDVDGDPGTDPEPDIHLTKQVWNKAEGRYTDTIQVTDRKDEIKYLIRFTIGEELSIEDSVEIRDTLPEELELAAAPEKAVIVRVDGKLATDGMLTTDGQVISYLFRQNDSFDIKSLIGSGIEMEVSTKIKDSVPAKELSGTITNVGTVWIDGDENGDTEPPVPPIEPPTGPELPDKDDFTKELIGKDGKPGGGLEIEGEAGELVNYLITLKLGGMEGYETMELVDRLDERFRFVSLQAVMNGVDVTDSIGKAGYQEKTNTVSYTFKEPLEGLKEQKIEFYLTVALRDRIRDYSDIHNTARLIVNSSETDTDGENGEKPKVELKRSYIEGYVWLDENNNSLRETEADTPVDHVLVILERYENGTWKVIGTTNTEADGRYVFYDIPYGEYRITVNNHIEGTRFVEKQVKGNVLNGIGSDVEPNGQVVFSVNKEQKEPKPSAGIRVSGSGGGTDPGTDPGGSGGNGDGKGDGNGEEENVFRKAPTNETIEPGETIEYVIKGFGNSLGREAKGFGISDILPEGLHFKSISLPAFTKGSGITYNITYITNLHGKRTLKSGLSAWKEQRAEAPVLQEGERVTYVTVEVGTVPHGFAIGDEIVVICQVDENPPASSLINDAALIYDGTEIYAKTSAVGIGKAPQTGDTSDFMPYTFIPVAALLLAAGLYRYGKRRKYHI